MLKKWVLSLLLLSSSVFAGGFDELETMTSLETALPYISKKVKLFYEGKTKEPEELAKKLYFAAVIHVTNGDTDKYLFMTDEQKNKMKQDVLILLKDWLRDVEMFNALAVIRLKEADAIKIIILQKKNKS